MNALCSAAAVCESGHRVMDRRRFLLTSLAGVLIAPPHIAGQPAGTPLRVGVLTLSVAASMPSFQAFLQGLHDQGYVEGRNIALEFRFADGRPERLGDMANDLLRLKVDVIVTESVLAAREARSATGGMSLTLRPLATSLRVVLRLARSVWTFNRSRSVLRRISMPRSMPSSLDARASL